MSNVKLKDSLNYEFVENFANLVKKYTSTFSTEFFVNDVFDDDWEELALRARMKKIASCYHVQIGSDFAAGVDVLIKISTDAQGFNYLFFADYVSMFGTAEHDWDKSMEALSIFTKGSSAEFAVRTFMKLDFEKTMKQMLLWSKDENEHLRRLSSEGCRTRLPWSEQVAALFENTALILTILENLKMDDSLYVRKSVANNLNDLSKDSPDIVIDIISRWGLTDARTSWIIKHGCRTLLKKGDSRTLELLGYAKKQGELKVDEVLFEVCDKKTQMGDVSTLSYRLLVEVKKPLKIKLGVAFYFVKANGSVSKKFFHLVDKLVDEKTIIEGKKKYVWEDLTTRKHYPGKHVITLLLNGDEIAETTIILTT